MGRGKKRAAVEAEQIQDDAPSDATGDLSLSVMLVILAELQGCFGKLLEMVQGAIVTGVAPEATVNASKKKGKKEKREPSSFNMFISRALKLFKAAAESLPDGDSAPSTQELFRQANKAWADSSEAQRAEFKQLFSTNPKDPKLGELMRALCNAPPLTAAAEAGAAVAEAADEEAAELGGEEEPLLETQEAGAPSQAPAATQEKKKKKRLRDLPMAKVATQEEVAEGGSQPGAEKPKKKKRKQKENEAAASDTQE